VQIVAVGVSHNSSSASLRERLAIPADALPGVLCRLRESVGETFILSTCNRVELYAVCGHEATGADMLRQFLAAHAEVPVGAVREASYAYGHESAVRHLLRVASGLDSLILGESEVLGQVRRALGASRQAGTLGPVLDRLGDAALACGKRTRSSTALGRDGVSVASVGLRLAARERGGLEGASVVVLGAGETAGQVLSRLATITGVRATVVNRTLERAEALAAAHRADVRPWSELSSVLADADVVIGCTASPTPVLNAAALAGARQGAPPRPLVCLDLGVPRDIDADVCSLPAVTLIDVARIGREAAVRRTARARDVARAEAIVVEETERYMEWWRGRGVASTVARLHARAEAIREAELDRALARLPELTARERAVIGELATRVIAKLLHEPTVALKRDPEGANMAVVVERLFALADIGALPAIAVEPCARTESSPHHEPHQESIAS
jgi:glutamyl-tRNA reductase